MLTKPIAFLKKIWAAAPFATVILILARTASLVFGVRTTVFWIKRPILAERFLPVAGWMTPRYIARSWQVPPHEIMRAIQAPMPPPDGPMSLAELAKFRGVDLEQVIAEVEAAIAKVKIERGDPDPFAAKPSEQSHD